MSSPYTTLGLPPDGVAWAALGAAVLLPAVHLMNRRARPLTLLPKRLVPLLAFGAALLSAGYVAFYLRGGPRIIDATSYYLQARAMAAGHFAFPVPAPLGSFEGRFLLPNRSGSLSVIFPPGYAALLAAGFLVHAPLLVGPLLAALLVLVTFALARELSGRDDAAYLAAGLSVVCAALRYHTADTMSHGLCAFLLCSAALTALRRKRWDALLCGIAIGWLIATRPVSGAVGLLLALSLLEPGARRWAWFGLGLLPGIALLLAYQHAATGSAWSSTQLAYYGLADGPPGCFRYGFGPGVGCLHEHGDYVRARLPNGYGFGEMASVTLRRLSVHCIDIANAAPLSVLCLCGAWQGRADARVRRIFWACPGLMLAYALFYFDGSYPGGGARLFADLLPLEHVLLALALTRLAWQSFALPISLLGFALHASFAHRALAEREGGRPMFEAQTLARAGVSHGLVFVDTDHGFNLGHAPGVVDVAEHVIVARYAHDAHDFTLWSELGRPPTYRYSYFASGEHAGQSALVPYLPSSAALRFEAEAEWPPLWIEPQSGWLEPDFVPCASGGRGLRLHPTGPSPELAFELGLPFPGPGPHSIELGWVRAPGPSTVIHLGWGAGVASVAVPAGVEGCVVAVLTLESQSPQPFRIRASRPGLLDYIAILP